jgi:tetratricopeptide (TPR) repeat protein
MVNLKRHSVKLDALARPVQKRPLPRSSPGVSRVALLQRGHSCGAASEHAGECARDEAQSLTAFRAKTLRAAMLFLLGLLAAVPGFAVTVPPGQSLMSLLLSQPGIDTAARPAITATFDPPIVGPGELSVYRVTVNALQDSVELPARIPAPAQLQLRAGAHGQILRMAGPEFLPDTTFIFHVHASAIGEFTIPQFPLVVYGKPALVPAAKLVVSGIPGMAQASAHQLFVEMPKTNFYVGQEAPVRVLLPSSGRGMQIVSQVQLKGDGLVTDPSVARQIFERRPHDGTNVLTYIYETEMIPIKPGKLTFFAQGYTIRPPTLPPAVLSGGRPVFPPSPYFLLDSEPLQLYAEPLPREGQLPGFVGAIGQFSLGPTTLSAETVRVGDPIQISVTIRGTGDLSRLVPPPPPILNDWQVFGGSQEPVPGQPAQPGATFTYTMIPLTADTKTTPPIPFSYFDPDLRAYRDLTFPALPVKVIPSPAGADIQALLTPDRLASNAQSGPVLSGLATSPGLVADSLGPLQNRSWFPLVQLAPGLGFLVLWLWDTRRRYLERHPDVVLRRRARRALRRARRSLRLALREANAQHFAAAAVGALRIAAAPGFPAEPRALVTADIIEAIGKERLSERAEEAVRRIFAFNNAMRFGRETEPGAGVLDLHLDIEQVLARLEAKLREDGTGTKAAASPAVHEPNGLRPGKATAFSTSLVLVLAGLAANHALAASGEALFHAGAAAYQAGDYLAAARDFRKSAALQPAAGTLQNLGNAEWQIGEVGAAILAWERSLWLDPYSSAARQDLRFARNAAQLPAPDLPWYEVVSIWIPAKWWAWITGLSLWVAVAMVLLPGVLRRPLTAWHQAVAAFGLMIFLLSIPAEVGVYTRSRIGFVMHKDTPLRLTPTADAQILTRLAPGEPGRLERVNNSFMLIRAGDVRGWVRPEEFALTCPAR